MEKYGKMSSNIPDKMHGGSNFENNLNQIENCKFQKYLPIVLLASKTWYCHQFFADFTYFVPLARDLFLHSWLPCHENGPNRNTKESIT